jgi:peroxiredoxin
LIDGEHRAFAAFVDSPVIFRAATDVHSTAKSLRPGFWPGKRMFLYGRTLIMDSSDLQATAHPTYSHATPVATAKATPLPPGAVAPEFTLFSTPDQTLSLSEFRGQPVILAFYPADWSPVCGDQMSLYNEILPEFHRFGAQLLGISVDGKWCHAAFADARKLHFPLLADFEPKGAVARSYNVYHAKDGISERALFVIDEDGIIQWSYISPIGVNPGADGILRALEALPAKEVTQR